MQPQLLGAPVTECRDTLGVGTAIGGLLDLKDFATIFSHIKLRKAPCHHIRVRLLTVLLLLQLCLVPNTLLKFLFFQEVLVDYVMIFGLSGVGADHLHFLFIYLLFSLFLIYSSHSLHFLVVLFVQPLLKSLATIQGVYLPCIV